MYLWWYRHSEKKKKLKGLFGNGEREVESEEMDQEEEVIHCLIEAGADPNQLASSYYSPLYEAIRLGMEKRAEVLIGSELTYMLTVKSRKNSLVALLPTKQSTEPRSTSSCPHASVLQYGSKTDKKTITLTSLHKSGLFLLLL